MRGDQHALAAQYARQNLLHVTGQHPRCGILQALAARRRHVIRAAPEMYPLLAPFLDGRGPRDAGELTVVALVEMRIAYNRDAGLLEFIKDNVERPLGAFQRRCETHVETHP